ncbi:MAG TPA: sigma-70 family RNA polymerase sigma factor [Gemmatimonadaceae bacterium]|jgi:RNA polymerase sigma-70 factor (ECF subfamily)|nr:sigma-70 family RNA polymerase sigma factor [Gemmatimonadaceae bacterium]
MSTSSFDDVIADFRGGEVSAFERVWREHLPQILSDVRQYSGQYDEIQDILQEIRISLYRSCHAFTGTGELSAWIHGVCRRCCLHWLRAKTRCQKYMASYVDLCGEAITCPFDDAMDCEEQTFQYERVLHALAILTERQRQVVTLRTIHGYSTKEVALVLQCAPGTVKATYFAAIHRLQTYLCPSSRSTQ